MVNRGKVDIKGTIIIANAMLNHTALTLEAGKQRIIINSKGHTLYFHTGSAFLYPGV